MKIIDVIGVALIILGLSISVMNLLASRRSIAGGPATGVQSFNPHETRPLGAGNKI